VSVKVGDKVLLPEYGGTKVSMEEKVSIVMYFMLVECISGMMSCVGALCCYYQTTQY